MRYAIYGAGAMGGTLGALIEKSGGTIDLYARNPAHVAAVRKRGLTLRCSADQTSFTVRPAIFTPEEMPARTRQNGRYDVIFLMTKQRDNEKIVTYLKDFLSGNGVVVTTQNGLPEESVAKIVGAEKTFGAVCSFGANFTTPGEAELTSTLASAKICIGAYAPPRYLHVCADVGTIRKYPRAFTAGCRNHQRKFLSRNGKSRGRKVREADRQRGVFFAFRRYGTHVRRNRRR